jgi:hypothetical protein
VRLHCALADRPPIFRRRAGGIPRRDGFPAPWVRGSVAIDSPLVGTPLAACACMRTLRESIWGALQIALHIALGPVLHRWRTRWGATAEEIARPLPGDELVSSPAWTYNHAITIAAPRSAVWRWLVQVGQQRGGFYSYEGLENLVGCDMRNVLEIRSDLQDLHIGDTIRMHASGFGPPVTVLEPERSLVLGGPPDPTGSRTTWSFHVFDAPGGTRLLERGLSRPGRGWLAQLAAGPYLLDPIGFVMSRKMLRTIKRLAEAQAGSGISHI